MNASIIAAGRLRGEPMLLDLYPQFDVTYSFYKLKSSYTDRCCRIRRSDNAERDIFFAGNYVDTADILSFVGAGDGFLVLIENQVNPVAAEYAYDVQANRQPRIVSSGVLETENGRLVIDFYPGGTSIPPLLIDTSFDLRTAFSIAKIEAYNTANYVAYGTGGIGFGGTSGGVNGMFSFDTSTAVSSTGESLTRKLGVFNLRVNDMYIAEDGDAMVNEGTQNLYDINRFGGRRDITAGYSRARVEMLLGSDTDLSTDINDIRTIINNLYDVY
jgi:hypothetical protein